MKKKEQFVKIKNLSVSKVLFDFINNELLKGIKSLLYNDGYTIRGVQKVIKEIGTKKILQKDY